VALPPHGPLQPRHEFRIVANDLREIRRHHGHDVLLAQLHLHRPDGEDRMHEFVQHGLGRHRAGGIRLLELDLPLGGDERSIVLARIGRPSVAKRDVVTAVSLDQRLIQLGRHYLSSSEKTRVVADKQMTQGQRDRESITFFQFIEMQSTRLMEIACVNFAADHEECID